MTNDQDRHNQLPTVSVQSWPGLPRCGLGCVTDAEKVLQQVEQICKRYGVSERAVGHRLIRDPYAFIRLREGNVTIRKLYQMKEALGAVPE